VVEEKKAETVPVAGSIPVAEPKKEVVKPDDKKADQEPKKTEPVKAEPLKAEPVKAEPVKAEPVKVESKELPPKISEASPTKNVSAPPSPPVKLEKSVANPIATKPDTGKINEIPERDKPKTDPQPAVLTAKK
jgi:hypothetical protein